MVTGCSGAKVNLTQGKGDRVQQEKTFDTGSVKINYLDYGITSDEALVMLHGGAWCWQEFLSLIPALGRERRIYALDGRGNGKSGWVPDTYRLKDFTDDVSSFVNHQERPVVLLGHSIGGVTALMTAERCPQKVKALIIEDAPLTLENYRNVIDASRDMFSLWLDLKQSARSELELALALASKYSNFPGVTSSWILFFAGCLWRLDPTYFNTLLRDFDGFAADYDYRKILSSLRCPVLFIKGEKALGAVMTDGEIDFIRKQNGSAQCVEIQGVGHLLHLQDQGQTSVLRAIREFLQQIPA
jgi:pimeloyl-ACP methyl ester carboxylesterase